MFQVSFSVWSWVSTTNWHLLSIFRRIKSCVAAPVGLQHRLTFNTPWEEFRVENRNKAPCDLGKTGRTSLPIFRSWFYETNSCISSYLEKHWIPLRWHLSLMIRSTLMRLAETFCKEHVLDCVYSPFTKVT